jgi:hypothetical protein
VIAAQEAFFGKTRDDLESAMGSYLARLKAFTSRIAMPQPRVQELEQMIRGAHAQVTAQATGAEEANEVHLDGRDSDEVLASLETLFDGRVGDPMSPDKLEAARKEAKRRVDHKIPPGYADKDKSDPSGDYLVWRHLLDEAASRRLPVVLVTDDRKEDWVRREHGLTLGPRPELCEEMSAEAGVMFLLMSTATFLRHAKEYLSASVSPETVDQARELPAALDERQRALFEEMRGEALAELRVLRQQADHAAMEAGHAEAVLKAAEREASAGGSDAKEEALHALHIAHARRVEVEGRRDALMAEEERIMAVLGAIDIDGETHRVQLNPKDLEYRAWLLSKLRKTTYQTPVR